MKMPLGLRIVTSSAWADTFRPSLDAQDSLPDVQDNFFVMHPSTPYAAAKSIKWLELPRQTSCHPPRHRALSRRESSHLIPIAPCYAP